MVDATLAASLAVEEGGPPPAISPRALSGLLPCSISPSYICEIFKLPMRSGQRNVVISVSASGLEKMTGHGPGIGNSTAVVKQAIALYWYSPSGPIDVSSTMWKSLPSYKIYIFNVVFLLNLHHFLRKAI